MGIVRRVLRRLERYKNLSELEDSQRLSLRRQRVSIALARAAVTSSLRELDPSNPVSWSFCGFSQNGEDGIIEYLTRKLRAPNRYFIEIGAADGLENNSAWLAIARRYSGVMIEGDRQASAICQQIISGAGGLNNHVESLCLMATPEDPARIVESALMANPDLFSIDIDGVDYYVADALFKAGLRPKICVVEYNSAYGPAHSQTVRYRPDFRCEYEDRERFLYYGAGIRGWRNFFSRHGYDFVTVEENGINAFFADPSEFESGFLSGLKGLEYRENVWHRMRVRSGWEAQYKVIEKLGLVKIEQPEQQSSTNGLPMFSG